jgi:hypothetical protein
VIPHPGNVPGRTSNNLILVIKGLLYAQFTGAHPVGGLVSFLRVEERSVFKDGLNGKNDELATAAFT